MWNDEILEEIHKYREEYAKSFNYDLHAIVEDLRRKQAARVKQIISKPLKESKKPMQST
jgi:predicted TIM-barrel fold metal-dependent hydrolase